MWNGLRVCITFGFAELILEEIVELKRWLFPPVETTPRHHFFGKCLGLGGVAIFANDCLPLLSPFSYVSHKLLQRVRRESGIQYSKKLKSFWSGQS